MRTLSVLMLLLATQAAHAEDVAPSPAGAEALRQSLQAQWGTLAASGGPLEVTPSGPGYALKLDLSGLSRLLPGLVLQPATVTIAAVQQRDGLWRVTNASFPSMRVDGMQGRTSTTVASYQWAGIFDPALMSFRTARSVETDARTETISDVVYQLVSKRSGLIEWDAVAAEAGRGIDGALHSRYEGARAEVRSPIVPGTEPSTAPLIISVAYGSGEMRSNLKGLKTQDIADVIAFASTSPKGPEARSRYDALFGRMGSPIRAMSFDGSVQDLAVGYPGGQGRVAKLTSSQSVSLVDKDRAMALAIAAEGIGVEGEVGPVLSALGVPRDVSLAVKFAGPRFDAAVALLLQRLSEVLASPEHAKGAFPDLSAGILPDNTAVIAVDTIALAGEGYAVEGSGAITLHIVPGQKPVPTGRLTVRARGLDRVLAQLKPVAATPQGRGFTGALVFAKGLAKPGPDGGLEWVIGIEGKSLDVNGTSFPLP